LGNFSAFLRIDLGEKWFGITFWAISSQTHLVTLLGSY
jgi:hypothetical protein